MPRSICSASHECTQSTVHSHTHTHTHSAALIFGAPNWNSQLKLIYIFHFAFRLENLYRLNSFWMSQTSLPFNWVSIKCCVLVLVAVDAAACFCTVERRNGKSVHSHERIEIESAIITSCIGSSWSARRTHTHTPANSFFFSGRASSNEYK